MSESMIEQVVMSAKIGERIGWLELPNWDWVMIDALADGSFTWCAKYTSEYGGGCVYPMENMRYAKSFGLEIEAKRDLVEVLIRKLQEVA